jgi:hypothetical protein
MTRGTGYSRFANRGPKRAVKVCAQIGREASFASFRCVAGSSQPLTAAFAYKRFTEICLEQGVSGAPLLRTRSRECWRRTGSVSPPRLLDTASFCRELDDALRRSSFRELNHPLPSGRATLLMRSDFFGAGHACLRKAQNCAA